MRVRLWLSIFSLWPAAALAAGNTSSYSKFDIEKTCTKIEAGDQYAFAGTWKCPGFKGIDIVLSSGDDRDFVGFGRNAKTTCAIRKTFNRFNTALSPVEWRLRNGKPFAAIERWRVTTDDEGGEVTWLVVTALKGNEACHVHYVAGAYPDANAQARRAADDLAEGFNCNTDVPTVDSETGPPGIALVACKDLPGE
jgi:hypothetical protein